VSYALITGGPAVWRDLQGEIVVDDGEFVVVRLESRDDAGTGTYDVRMPKTCIVEITEEPAA